MRVELSLDVVRGRGVRGSVPSSLLLEDAGLFLLSARKLLLRGAGRAEPGRGAGTGCEGVWGERGAEE